MHQTDNDIKEKITRIRDKPHMGDVSVGGRGGVIGRLKTGYTIRWVNARINKIINRVENNLHQKSCIERIYNTVRDCCKAIYTRNNINIKQGPWCSKLSRPDHDSYK